MQKRLTWVALVSAAIVITPLYHARKVHAALAVSNVQERGSSVASLKGTYAFRRTGMNNVVGGPIAQIGIDVFNGDGTRGRIRSTRSTNGAIRDWTDTPPNGSYTIDPDCTGSFFAVDGTKTYNIVVFDGGKRFLLLDLQPGTTISAELTRIEEDKD